MKCQAHFSGAIKKSLNVGHCYLTYLCITSHKWDLYKQCKPRSDLQNVSSGQSLHHAFKYRKLQVIIVNSDRTSLHLEMELSKKLW